jgi:hypothetical protein
MKLGLDDWAKRKALEVAQKLLGKSQAKALAIAAAAQIDVEPQR